MLTLLDLRNVADDGLLAALPRPIVESVDPTEVVREIIAEVRSKGDSALIAYGERFDGRAPLTLVVPREELQAAYDRLHPDLKDALELAAHSVRTFHEEEVAHLRAAAVVRQSGFSIETRLVAVERAGCYVPGGHARYPSSVIMTAGVAKAAGVREVVVSVPPGADGRIDDATLAACFICDVDYVVASGGAQAIAAMAYGTESVPKVDVIVGPGNIYVSVAKREVSSVVGVPSSFAGPSEVVVIADDSVPALWAGLDVVVQAEHGPHGLAWLITWDESYAKEVDREVASYVTSSPRMTHILSTLDDGGYIALVRDKEQAYAVSNLIAPEHLELLYRDSSDDLDLVENAGAVFVGPGGTAAFGDYIAGPSHVLPTFGTARFSSALGTSEFLKRIHFIEVGEDAADSVGWAVERIAAAESLVAHGASVAARRRGRT